MIWFLITIVLFLCFRIEVVSEKHDQLNADFRLHQIYYGRAIEKIDELLGPPKKQPIQVEWREPYQHPIDKSVDKFAQPVKDLTDKFIQEFTEKPDPT